MDTEQSTSLQKKIFRWLMIAGLIAIGLFIIVSLLVQIPSVQNWAVNQIANKVSRDLGTQVSIDHIKLDVFNDLVVDHLLILDETDDTLLYSKKAYFDLDQPLKGLYNKAVTFQQISLTQSKCYLKTNGSGRTNYQFLLDYLGQGQTDAIKLETQDSTFNQDGKFVIGFSPTYINISDISFEHINDEKGKYSYLYIPKGTAELKRILKDDPLHFRNITLEKPRFTFEKFPLQATGDLNVAPRREASNFDQVINAGYKAKKPLSLLVDELEIIGGYARVVNKFKPIRKTLASVVDFRDASARLINLTISDLIWEKDQGVFAVETLSMQTPEGFKIDDFQCQEVAIEPKQFLFNNYKLKTPNSLLANRISFKFDDIDDFNFFEDKVRLDGNFKNSHIALKDILYFANGLNENEFFQLNGGEKINVQGRVIGSINDLSGHNFNLNIADKGELNGQFSMKDITRVGEENIFFELNHAEADISTLRQLIPNFNLPKNYDKLGLLEFSGQFEGSFENFVASGDLTTDLGTLRSDLRITIPDSGISEASYVGNLELINFDLATWTDSDQYGRASFSAAVKDGKNLDIDAAFANLYAKLDHFHFNGYDYKDIILQGVLNKSFFDGQLYSEDPNLDLDFNGAIDYRDSIPHFDFTASIDHLDLNKLHLSRKQLSASGEIDFDFSLPDIYHLNGSAHGFNLEIKDEETLYDLDSISILSKLSDGEERVLSVNSNIFDFDLRGEFDLETLPATFKKLVNGKHPQFANKFNIDSFVTDSIIGSNDFIFEVVLEDSKGLQRIFDASLADFNQVELSGYFQNNLDSNFAYRLSVEAPTLDFKKNKIENLALDFDGRNEKSTWDITTSKVWIGHRLIEPLELSGTLESDSLNFSIKSNDVANVLSSLDVSGLFYLNAGYYQIDLANSSFELLNEPWQIIPNNYIQVGERFLKTENMVFLSDDSYLRLSSPGDNSLQLEVEKLDISFLDDLFRKKQLAFEGNAYSTLRFADIFKPDKVEYNLAIDTLRINGDDYGMLEATASMPNLHQEGQFDLNIDAPPQSLVIDGQFHIPTVRNKGTYEALYTFDVQVSDYPLAIGEYFIGHSISESNGTFDSQFSLIDDAGRPAINGAVILDGSTKIDYLGTTYKMERQTVHVNPQLFDFTSTEFIDELGNRAYFKGGITHDYLKNPGLDATVSSDHFMFLNTTKKDNKIYYGKGIGEGHVEFTGNFKQADLRVRATTGAGSKISIPVDYNYSTGEHFIKYVFHEDSLAFRDASADLRGPNLDMQLNMTPDAEMQIIFDEFSGDIIKGTGNGNLTLTLERGGSLQMTGKYVIEQGQYLYTLLDFINKPFTIERGGLISWSGDPLAADLDIKATYTGLKVPPRNLIAEYLEGRNNSDVADISTQVNLGLGLRGILSQPQIDFDIQFPDIDPSLKNQTDSKIRVLKEDVSELNRQVYGLLFFNSFLPPSINLDLTATTVNTLSEFLTSQLSNYVAAYITEGMEEVDYISGVDFYFDYNFYRSEDFIQGQETGVKTGSEFALAPNIRFFDDRLAFSPGASIVEGTVLQGSTFIGTDVKLDFFLTEDKRLKLSLFYKRFPSLNGGRNKLGLGFRFFKRYDSIGDIFRRKKGDKLLEPSLPIGDEETSLNN